MRARATADGVLYVIKSNNGILSAFGTLLASRTTRINGWMRCRMSRRRGGARISAFRPRGATLVLVGPKFEVVGVNTLDDGFGVTGAGGWRNLSARILSRSTAALEAPVFHLRTSGS
jgi:hypothetical protein